MTRTNNIGSKLPEGHNSPAAGFGSRSGAAGLTKGVGRRDSIGSAQEEFSDQMGPVIRTGSGAQRQGEETDDVTIGDYKFKGVPASEARAAIDGHSSGEVSLEEITLLLEPYLDTSEDDNKRNKDGKPVGESTKQERIADDGPTDGEIKGNYVNTEKVKGIFGNPIRFAPGEEPSEGGVVDPSLLGTIQSSKTQVKTIDGLDASSFNPEDLSDQIQDALEQGGQGNPINQK